MSWKLRTDDDCLTTDLEHLARAGLLEFAQPVPPLAGYWFVSNFAKRQSAIPDNQRKQAQRERESRYVTDNVTERDLDNRQRQRIKKQTEIKDTELIGIKTTTTTTQQNHNDENEPVVVVVGDEQEDIVSDSETESEHEWLSGVKKITQHYSLAGRQIKNPKSFVAHWLYAITQESIKYPGMYAISVQTEEPPEQYLELIETVCPGELSGMKYSLNDNRAREAVRELDNQQCLELISKVYHD